ncbi:MAG: YkgJ family cysteine cluster protein [Desulfobacterales bacterium]|nr:YkgJ family cysteine cluster protein [Desulfobacterales bacterium]
MKQIDLNDINKLLGIRLEKNDIFKFRCHPGVSCFNLCCRNLNLFLYPYDVIRLKNNLGISSDRFLDDYVDVVLRPGSHFPEVLLKMSGTEEKTCPFLTPGGCTVYPDRPDTCRTFPIEQGAVYDAKTDNVNRVQFFRPPDFCRGQDEETEWTPQTWANDQNAETYNKMTLRWYEIRRLFEDNPWGHEGPDGRKAKMAFMATYNIDGLKDFIFNSTFLKRFKLKSSTQKRIKKDDKALLLFGFEWIKFYIWGIQSKEIIVKK